MDTFVTIGVASLTVGTAAGFLAAIVRMYASNERAKSEMTVNMLLDFTNKLDFVTDQCVLLTDPLTDNDIGMIWSGGIVKIDATDKKRKVLECIFQIDDLVTENDKYVLSDKQCKLIEFHWKTYLNRLEFMLAAWTEQLVNEDIMLSQLGKFLDYKQPSLRKLIVKSIEQYFPITNKFLEKKLYKEGPNPRKNLWILRILSK